MTKRKAKPDQLQARALRPYMRRVLWEMRRANVTMTIDHIVTELEFSNRYVLEVARRPMWPLRQVIGLERLGFAAKYSVNGGEFSVTLWRITEQGKRIAGWCYRDGGVSNG